MPASAFSHAGAGPEPTLAIEATMADGVHMQLSSRVTGGAAKPKSVQYYAVNDHFDYFSQQGSTSADYFLAETSTPESPLRVPIWGGERKVIRARAVLPDFSSFDSPPIAIAATSASLPADRNVLRPTALEHHLYPLNSGVEGDRVTLVGESMGLLTRECKGDVTIVAHLAEMTSNGPRPDGTQLEGPGNWYSGVILRQNLKERPGMPLGGNDIPYIALVGAADGTTRRCDSTLIDGAGNQPSGDIGGDSKWFKLSRTGAELSAFISKDGKDWKQVRSFTLPQSSNGQPHAVAVPALSDELEVGFVHYAQPSAVPLIHWATFDHVSITCAGR